MTKNLKTEYALEEKDLDRALTRIAHEIIERNHGVENVALVGILTRGATLAKRIQALLEKLEKKTAPVGFMDINLYRDDAATRLDQPVIQRTDILFDVRDKHIVLVDDVLYTGRTIRAAMEQLIDFGRPRSVQLAVLIDRGHRELPIRADYVGKNIPTSKDDQVLVRLRETDGVDAVEVERMSTRKLAKGRSTPVGAKNSQKAKR